MPAVLSATRRAQITRAWRRGLPWGVDVALAPAAWLYRGGLALREALYARGWLRSCRLPCPVVSVGNLTVGGTGKTPVVECVGRWLDGAGYRVAVVSRGYGGRRTAPVVLVSDGERLLANAGEAGDEPVLLASRFLRSGLRIPVVVGRDRRAAGAFALARPGADVLVLDDGFQQRRLRKDVEIVCVDARAPWGRGALLPRGSLREPPAALGRADLLVLVHAPGGAIAEAVRLHAPSAPLLLGRYVAEDLVEAGSGAVRPVMALRERRVLAFAGIAVPEGLAETLAEHGAIVRELVPWPDHHRYTAADLEALGHRAVAAGADTLVTTEKDLVRLPAGPRSGAAVPVWALRARLRLDGDERAWRAALLARLRAAGR